MTERTKHIKSIHYVEGWGGSGCCAIVLLNWRPASNNTFLLFSCPWLYQKIKNWQLLNRGDLEIVERNNIIDRCRGDIEYLKERNSIISEDLMDRQVQLEELRMRKKRVIEELETKRLVK